MENKKITFKELTGVLRLTTFLERYTSINPKGGVYHRLNGKGTGTQSKTKDLTIEEKTQLSSALKELTIDINNVVKSFDKDLKNDKI